MKTIKTLVTGLFFLFAVQISFAQTNELAVVNYEVNSTCGSCKAKIENALNKTDGVKFSNLDLESKVVTVKFIEAEVSKENIAEVIQEEGYTTKLVENLKAKKNTNKCNPHCHSKCGGK